MSKTYSKKHKHITAKVGEVFSVKLDSNPTTGYQWVPDLDSDKVKLVEQKFETGPNRLGASGEEVFTFKTLAPGASTIQLTYKRSWDNESAESHHIKLETQD